MVHTPSQFDTGRNNSRVSDAEKEKHEHYDAVCDSAGLSFKAFGLSTFGEAGPDANETMNTISSKIVSNSRKQDGNFLASAARERIIVACMRGVGAQLLSTFHMEEDDPVPQEWAETPEEPCPEVAEHELRELEDRALDAVDNSGTLPAGCPDKTDALWSIYRFSREISAPHASTFLDSPAGLPKSHLLDLLGDPAGLKAFLDMFLFNNPAPRQYETSYPQSRDSHRAQPPPRIRNERHPWPWTLKRSPGEKAGP